MIDISTGTILRDFLSEGAVYSLDDDEIWIGWKLDARSASDRPSVQVVSPDFFLNQRSSLDCTTSRHAVVGRAELHRALERFQTESHERGEFSQTTREIFFERFQSLARLIDGGRLAKGVPYGQLRMSAPVGPAWIAHRLCSCLEKESATHVYGIWDQKRGIIGCSPERLCQFRARENILASEAVAGTRALAGYAPGNLLGDAKAMREHAFVVEDLAERLSSFGPVQIGQTSEWKVPGLVHLKTPLQVAPRRGPNSLGEVIRRLHPTAALGVYPRNDAGRAWLEEAERTLPRWRFGAPFGISRKQAESEENAEDFSCVVAIRNVEWRENDVRISAGCGVIQGSEVEAEWQECLEKIQSIRNLLDL